jgi:cyclic pyranopterin phosphate synthase
MPEVEKSCFKVKDTLSKEDILRIIEAAASLGIKKIRYTGGEPLVYKDIVELIRDTYKISKIEEVSITTNGIMLADMLDDLIKAGLRRVNISLDTLDEVKFKAITRFGNLKEVLNAVYKCIEKGLKPVKLNTVLMKGINDHEIDAFINLTKELPVEVRFIELMPIGEGINFYEDCRLSSEEVLCKHPELSAVKEGKQSTAAMYTLPKALGRIGFINPISCKFCSSCNKIRLTCDGKIKPCLHSCEEIDIKQFLHNKEKIIEALKAAIIKKPLEHRLIEENISRSRKMMYEIGG